MNALRTAAAVAPLLLWGVTACGTSTSGSGKSEMESMVSNCEVTQSEKVSPGSFDTGDAGHSILIDTNNDAGDISMLACILIKTGASQALIHDMDATTAMMGRQHAEEHGYTYEWSYHPDSGVNMTITEH